MAIYHANIKNFSRGKGESATAAAAYRAGIDILDTRTRKLHHYSRRGGVVSHHMLAPAGAPQWCNDPAVFFDACEGWESRANAIVGRELEVSLPHEMNTEQRERLALSLGQLLVDRYQTVVLVAIHSPSPKGDQRNFHVHLLMSSRRVGTDGLGSRAGAEFDARGGRGADEIRVVRALVSDTINKALKSAGFSESVDHRTLREQARAAAEAGDLVKAAELTREPTRHIGRALTAALRRGTQDPLLVRAGITLDPAQQAMEEAMAKFARQGRLQAASSDRPASETTRVGSELDTRLGNAKDRARQRVRESLGKSSAGLVSDAMQKAEAALTQQGRLVPTPAADGARAARADRAREHGRAEQGRRPATGPSALAIRLGRVARLARSQGDDAELLNQQAKLIEDWLEAQNEIARDALESLQAIPGLQVEPQMRQAIETAKRRRVGVYGSNPFFYEDSEMLSGAITEYVAAMRQPSEKREVLRQARARLSEIEAAAKRSDQAKLVAAKRALAKARAAVGRSASVAAERRINEARAVMVAAREAMERDYYITPLDRVETCPPQPYTAGPGGGERKSDSNRAELKPSPKARI